MSNSELRGARGIYSPSVPLIGVAVGDAFVPTGNSLADIAGIDISGLPAELFECKITIATDVKNPLLGEHGATFVYAPQKGLVKEQRERLGDGMSHYARVIQRRVLFGF